MILILISMVGTYVVKYCPLHCNSSFLYTLSKQYFANDKNESCCSARFSIFSISHTRFMQLGYDDQSDHVCIPEAAWLIK